MAVLSLVPLVPLKEVFWACPVYVSNVLILLTTLTLPVVLRSGLLTSGDCIRIPCSALKKSMAALGRYGSADGISQTCRKCPASYVSDERYKSDVPACHRTDTVAAERVIREFHP